MVLAARRAGALEDLARECEAAGGQTLAVPTDMTDEAAVAKLAQRAVERFGRIDIWVNHHPDQQLPVILSDGSGRRSRFLQHSLTSRLQQKATTRYERGQWRLSNGSKPGRW